MVENTFLTVKENVVNSPSRKTEGGEGEEQVAVLEKQQKKLALDGKMYTKIQFIKYYCTRCLDTFCVSDCQRCLIPGTVLIPIRFCAPL